MDSENNTTEKKQHSYILSKWIYLRALGLVHLAAFGSYAYEILGLNGEHGVLPTALLLERIRSVYGESYFLINPALTWLNSSDQMLLAICWSGVFLAILVTMGILTAPCLLILAILYLTLVNSGGEFTGFQSDGLLVEVTVLSLFLAPWKKIIDFPVKTSEAASKAGTLLIRFLLFRLMFAAGAVKLLSGDPTWQNLTALSYHFETQPIPTPLAWFAHHMPMWFHKLSVVATFVIELILPLFYFASGMLAYVAAAGTALLHAMIAITGNYTFLNLLTIVLCIVLIDDSVWNNILPGKFLNWLIKEEEIQKSEIPKAKKVQTTLVNIAAGIMFFFASIQFAYGLGFRRFIPAPLLQALSEVSPWRLFNSYGLFAVMTTERPEIVFEGSADGKVWKTYEFKYKVGDVRKAPPIIAPHMARLDWRLWFAAMGRIEENPWVILLVKRLLDGDREMDMFFRDNPFKDKPPKYIRAYVYDYHFSDWDELKKGIWWRRDNKRIFLEPVDANMMPLVKPY